MGSKKNVDMSATENIIKVVANPDAPETTDAVTEEIAETTGEGVKGGKNAEASEAKDANVEKKATKKTAKAAVPKRVRSRKYVSTRSKVDKTRKYAVAEAVATVKKLSYSKFDGTITLDGVVKEVGKVASTTLPHSTGKTIKVAIVDDALLAEIEAGNLNFDALITSPQYMPKLAKFARILGPKGLMPNPKNGTVTPKPELKKAELERGTFEIKTEKKSPVIHISIGKVSMDDKALVENIESLMVAMKGKIVSASISATMSPSVKLEVAR